mmetsp:Transcript_24070/g.79841  ORF Transcript_24070/g.79841 Transcript_24070/m.79841 type:complete len:229 (+) Transcript_24070:156-842(+)
MRRPRAWTRARTALNAGLGRIAGPTRARGGLPTISKRRSRSGSRRAPSPATPATGSGAVPGIRRSSTSTSSTNTRAATAERPRCSRRRTCGSATASTAVAGASPCDATGWWTGTRRRTARERPRSPTTPSSTTRSTGACSRRRSRGPTGSSGGRRTCTCEAAWRCSRARAWTRRGSWASRSGGRSRGSPGRASTTTRRGPSGATRSPPCTGPTSRACATRSSAPCRAG